mmetsp:Transcript_92251/g.152797  ORF Transcript_92251/g.152797 Transcript_92251/m.152797 type:complete len:229 (-) Transcript_92251:121-807(-)
MGAAEAALYRPTCHCCSCQELVIKGPAWHAKWEMMQVDMDAHREPQSLLRHQNDLPRPAYLAYLDEAADAAEDVGVAAESEHALSAALQPRLEIDWPLLDTFDLLALRDFTREDVQDFQHSVAEAYRRRRVRGRMLDLGDEPPQGSNQEELFTTEALAACTSIYERPSLSDDREALHCTICLGAISAGEDVRALPCTHQFHVACIDPWLRTCFARCPNCQSHLAHGPA